LSYAYENGSRVQSSMESTVVVERSM
jgi:hypothetical protein